LFVNDVVAAGAEVLVDISVVLLENDAAVVVNATTGLLSVVGGTVIGDDVVVVNVVELIILTVRCIPASQCAPAARVH